MSQTQRVSRGCEADRVVFGAEGDAVVKKKKRRIVYFPLYGRGFMISLDVGGSSRIRAHRAEAEL